MTNVSHSLLAARKTYLCDQGIHPILQNFTGRDMFHRPLLIGPLFNEHVSPAQQRPFKGSALVLNDKVSQSAKDIGTLQVNLKEKDKMVDQMKTAGSKLKSMLSSQQKKNEELETANASMSTELQAVRARIQKLEDFVK
ncbi:hypothetical protein N7465_007886 [Penicillium sp. CMV-2018d]|nr:hypothetical protein N7465_007886 [Penicillium sp. CMV-2018d]